MLELFRSLSSLRNLPAKGAGSHGFSVGLARSDEEIEALQRLRYDVFSAEYSDKVAAPGQNIDKDSFDSWCEHLMVKDMASDQVVGTYRVLTPHQAKRAGGYYSESEFDLSALGEIKESLVEFGRACIRNDFRNGAVLMMLWSGLAEILKQGGYEHVFGCASVSLRDDGITAASVWREVRDSLGQNAMPVVRPLLHYPVDQLDSNVPAEMPPLLRGYLKLGARVCGEPAWDPDFNTADFPMLLSVSKMGSRYRRHFGFE